MVLFESSLKLLATISTDIKSELVREQSVAFLMKIQKEPLNGDLEYVKEVSLDFCRKRSLMKAIEKVLELAEQSNFDKISSIVQKSLQVGAEKNIGHVFKEQLDSRFIESQRNPITTGWFYIDEVLNGGVGRGELVVFMSPTGIGKCCDGNTYVEVQFNEIRINNKVFYEWDKIKTKRGLIYAKDINSTDEIIE